MRRALGLAAYGMFLLFGFGTIASGQGLEAPKAVAGAETAAAPQLVIIDTDIGDDVDDAYALGLAIQSPELKILGITTAWENTPLRARMVARFLTETGHPEIPVAAGLEKYPPNYKSGFSQAKYAERGPVKQFPAAVDFLLQQIRNFPGQITLIAIGPQTNLGAAIDRDAQTFRKLKRIVLMGGSVYRGYDGFSYPTGKGEARAEWNIVCDVAAAQKVFSSGVPLFVMPLDSTQIRLQELERMRIFSHGSAPTDALASLTFQWMAFTGQGTPTLFDAMAVAYAIQPGICPTTAMRLEVDGAGNTRAASGKANAEVCLSSQSDRFFEFYMVRVLAD